MHKVLKNLQSQMNNFNGYLRILKEQEHDVKCEGSNDFLNINNGKDG